MKFTPHHRTGDKWFVIYEVSCLSHIDCHKISHIKYTNKAINIQPKSDLLSNTYLQNKNQQLYISV
jgi:hypothetical protein